MTVSLLYPTCSLGELEDSKLPRLVCFLYRSDDLHISFCPIRKESLTHRLTIIHVTEISAAKAEICSRLDGTQLSQ